MTDRELLVLAAPPGPKDHEIRDLVNNLTKVAREYHATQQLRERIAGFVVPFVRGVSQQPALVAQLAQQWDGCMYETPGGAIDIGACIRDAGRRLSGDSVVPTTQPSGATLEPGARSPVDRSFDEWYARQRHQLTNEQVCRLIWTRGWGAAARQYGEAYQREEARADAAEQRAEEAAQWISVDESHNAEAESPKTESQGRSSEREAPRADDCA